MSPLELLEWLAREDVSLYGECHGPVLDVLLGWELVTLDAAPPTSRTGVRVNEAGLAWLTQYRLTGF